MKVPAKNSLASLPKPDKAFFIRFNWGPRKESAGQSAVRLNQFLRELSSVDAAFRPWEVFVAGRSSNSDDLRFLALGGKLAPLNPKELTKHLLRGRNWTDPCKGEARRVIDALGFSIHLVASRGDVEILCGGTSPHVKNNCMVGLPSVGKVADRILRLPKLIRIAKVVIRNWNPDIGIITSTNCCLALGDRELEHQAGWITYVSDYFKRDLNVPRSAKIIRAGKGRLIVATKGRFSSGKSKHMAVVKELTRSLNAGA